LYSIRLDTKEKELLQFFQNNTHKTYIDKNEYLLFNLVKKKKVNINLIQEIWKEFDVLDTNAMGMITYEDIEGKVNKRQKVVRFDLEQDGGTSSTIAAVASDDGQVMKSPEKLML
jgi:hypothetical protein